MRVGERAILTCTSDYAYGESGSLPTIPGGATLRFDVEMISFKTHDEL
jgi:FKBP-type peptidyl-prolyl cis-trans isomerase